MAHIKDVWEVALGREVSIDEENFLSLERRNEKFKKLSGGKTIYGYNTGLGPLAEVKLSDKDLQEFQINTIRTHAASSGKPLPTPIVRAAMYIRALHILRGSAGIRPEVVRRFIEFLNLGITPEVPTYGSVGASGDLSPYSHIALALMGEGWVYLKNGNRVPSIVAHRMYSLEPLKLQPREALSIINGYTFSLSSLAIALYKLHRLFDISIAVYTLSWKAVKGRKSPLKPDVVGCMGDKYARDVAVKVWKHIEDFKDGDRVQDPYSFRCFPQIAGVYMRALKFSEDIFEELYKGFSDNPLVLDEGIHSSGNFHGQAISIAADTLSNAVTSYMGALERRVFFMLSGKSGLPVMLSPNPGKDSGYMMIQTSLASIFAESKVLSTPYSFQSVPTGNDQEDWVPMSFGASLRLIKISEYLLKSVAAEFLCSFKALKIRGVEDKICEDFEKFYPQYRKNLSVYEEWVLAEKFIKSKVGGWISL